MPISLRPACPLSLFLASFILSELLKFGNRRTDFTRAILLSFRIWFIFTYDLYCHFIIHLRKFRFIRIPSKYREALCRVPSIFYDHDNVSSLGERMTSRAREATAGCIHQTVVSEFIAPMARSYVFVPDILNIRQRPRRSIAIPTEGPSRWSLLRAAVAVIAGTRSDITKILYRRSDSVIPRSGSRVIVHSACENADYISRSSRADNVLMRDKIIRRRI